MRDENCIFCKIANGEIPSSTVYEDEEFRAILDLGPASKGHTLILPKEHFRDLTELPEDWCGKARFLAGRIGSAMKKELGAAGFNGVQNNGTEAGQTVFHFHVHVIPRKTKDGVGLLWKPGNPTEDEQKETCRLLAEQLK